MDDHYGQCCHQSPGPVAAEELEVCPREKDKNYSITGDRKSEEEVTFSRVSFAAPKKSSPTNGPSQSYTIKFNETRLKSATNSSTPLSHFGSSVSNT